MGNLFTIKSDDKKVSVEADEIVIQLFNDAAQYSFEGARFTISLPPKQWDAVRLAFTLTSEIGMFSPAATVVSPLQEAFSGVLLDATEQAAAPQRPTSPSSPALTLRVAKALFEEEAMKDYSTWNTSDWDKLISYWQDIFVIRARYLLEKIGPF